MHRSFRHKVRPNAVIKLLIHHIPTFSVSAIGLPISSEVQKHQVNNYCYAEITSNFRAEILNIECETWITVLVSVPSNIFPD